MRVTSPVKYSAVVLSLYGLTLAFVADTATPVAHAQSAKPIITKIDPPDWFTGLPDSLLLVHGENLENTIFALKKTAARITEASVSQNGHWAFLTLSAARATPGLIEITATNKRGVTSIPYALSARRKVADQPKGFSSADVMYLIMPDRFADGDPANNDLASFRAPNDRSASHAYHGGDLRGIQDHLDYLQQMGVTTIWTTPLYDNSASQSGQTYHGYSASDMYAVDPHFGSMADYQALTSAAHARGMKVVLDTVPNHVGPATPWAKDPPSQDWLHGSPASHVKVDDDFASVTDASASAVRRSVLLDGWFADFLPDLNQNDPLVAQYLVQNAIWWVESAGLDGLRIDTFPYVPRSFWHQYNELLHALYPRLTDVGEIFNQDARVTSFFAGGRANRGSDGTFDTLLDTPFDYPMYFALRGALTRHQPMTAISDVLNQDRLYPHPERLVTFIGNHDTKRFLSEAGASTGSLHLAFGLLATMRGMPQLYYGDEIGMDGGDDPENRKDFPGGFPQDKRNAFSELGRTAAQQTLFRWVETIMQLRGHTPALMRGEQQTLFADKDSFAFVRAVHITLGCMPSSGDDPLLVVVNNDVAPRAITILTPPNALVGCTHYEPMLQNGSTAQSSKDAVTVSLPAQEVGIFRARP